MGIGSADAFHTIVEAVKLAYADRDRYYGDPDFVQVPMAALLSDAYAASRRALIDPHAREPRAAAGAARSDRNGSGFRLFYENRKNGV